MHGGVRTRASVATVPRVTHSIRRQPFAPYCGGSQKKDKRVCNRIARRANRVRLAREGEEALFLRQDEALSPYAMSQDGSRGYRPLSAWDPARGYREWFRWAKAK
jgi:hypothetical protein